MLRILFCVFNEEENLKSFLPELDHSLCVLGGDFEMVVCIDGSDDGSLEVISGFDSDLIRILPIKNERGLGLAYKRLFLDSVESLGGDDLIISLDADNTHNPRQIIEMVEHFKKNSLDLLIASRFCHSAIMEKFPLHRKFISKSTSLLLQSLFGVRKINGDKLLDYTSGYRVYKARIIKDLFAKLGDDFIFEPEFTYTCEFAIKLAKIGGRIDELPISYDYGKKVGKSKLRIMRNLWRLVILLFKLKILR